MIFRARDDSLSIGREANDINFPDDPFISGRHAMVQAMETVDGTRFQIADLGSKNGTFVRVTDETALFHGDYVFLGQQLLRVEDHAEASLLELRQGEPDPLQVLPGLRRQS